MAKLDDLISWATVDGVKVPYMDANHFGEDGNRKRTGADNPLPSAQYVQNDKGVWLPVSADNPVPTQLTGSKVEKVFEATDIRDGDYFWFCGDNQTTGGNMEVTPIDISKHGKFSLQLTNNYDEKSGKIRIFVFDSLEKTKTNYLNVEGDYVRYIDLPNLEPGETVNYMPQDIPLIQGSVGIAVASYVSDKKPSDNGGFSLAIIGSKEGGYPENIPKKPKQLFIKEDVEILKSDGYVNLYENSHFTDLEYLEFATDGEAIQIKMGFMKDGEFQNISQPKADASGFTGFAPNGIIDEKNSKWIVNSFEDGKYKFTLKDKWTFPEGFVLNVKSYQQGDNPPKKISIIGHGVEYK